MSSIRLRIIITAACLGVIIIAAITFLLVREGSDKAAGVPLSSPQASVVSSSDPTPLDSTVGTVSSIPDSTSTPSSSPSAAPKYAETGSELENAKFGQSVTAVRYDYAVMQDEVSIHLDSDPRIQGGIISTEVPLRDETFTVFFKQPMDRQSVQNALTLIQDGRSRDLAYPKLLLHWTDDRQLHVKVLVTKVETWEEVPGSEMMYRLAFDGAQASDGKPLTGQYYFNGVVQTPVQLWRYALDGTVKEQLTDFTQPYGVRLLDQEGKQLWLVRSSHYCRCDAFYPFYSTIYDLETKTFTPYPFETQLTLNYRGAGKFIADSRGFFFEKLDSHIKIPTSDTAHTISMKEFIFGASFSKQHDYVIMAVGEKDQTRDYDLVILNLATGKQMRYKQAVKGGIPNDAAFGRILPFTFNDTGKKVYFAATDPVNQQAINYYFDWSTKKVTEWKPLVQQLEQAYFTESDDGTFQHYSMNGLFKNGKKVSVPFDTLNFFNGLWIPGTHRYLFRQFLDKDQSYVILDADSMKVKTLIPHAINEFYAHSITSDGKWVLLNVTDSKK